jgi:hypothetical protein
MSSENLFFNTARIAKTVEVARHFIAANKPIFLLYDDPELKLQVAGGKLDVGPLDFKRLTVWANADLGDEGKAALSRSVIYHRSASCADLVFENFPFNALLTYPEAVNSYVKDTAVYIGDHTGGRLKALQQVAFPLEIYYTSKNYPLTLAGKPPRQPERPAFYGQYRMTLGLQDSRHKKLRWFTGRLFHALSAGVPSVVPDDSFLAEWFTPISHWEHAWNNRADAYAQAIQLIYAQQQQITSLLDHHGL